MQSFSNPNLPQTTDFISVYQIFSTEELMEYNAAKRLRHAIWVKRNREFKQNLAKQKRKEIDFKSYLDEVVKVELSYSLYSLLRTLGSPEEDDDDIVARMARHLDNCNEFLTIIVPEPIIQSQTEERYYGRTRKIRLRRSTRDSLHVGAKSNEKRYEKAVYHCLSCIKYKEEKEKICKNDA